MTVSLNSLMLKEVSITDVDSSTVRCILVFTFLLPILHIANDDWFVINSFGWIVIVFTSQLGFILDKTNSNGFASYLVSIHSTQDYNVVCKNDRSVITDSLVSRLCHVFQCWVMCIWRLMCCALCCVCVCVCVYLCPSGWWLRVLCSEKDPQ